MMVLSVTVGLSKEPSILVAPCNVIPFVIMSVEVQLAVPAGTVTVSFSCAEAMADLTSARAALFASTVAAFTWPAAVSNTASAVAGKEGCLIYPRFLSNKRDRGLTCDGRGTGQNLSPANRSILLPVATHAFPRVPVVACIQRWDIS